MLLHIDNGEFWLRSSSTLREHEEEKILPFDAMGRPLEVGQVAVHFSVHGHAMESHPVIIRGFNSTGTIAVDRPGRDSRWDDETKKWVHTPCLKKGTVKKPAYLAIVEMTEAQVRKQYEIVDNA